jgi:hypothetical protein
MLSEFQTHRKLGTDKATSELILCNNKQKNFNERSDGFHLTKNGLKMYLFFLKEGDNCLRDFGT